MHATMVRARRRCFLAISLCLLLLAMCHSCPPSYADTRVKPICSKCACGLRTNQCHKICATGKTCHVDCETKCMHQPGYCPAKKLA